MSVAVIEKEVYDGIIAYRDGHYSIAMHHFSYARRAIQRVDVDGAIVNMLHVLLRLYWLKAFVAIGSGKKSQVMLVRAVLRRNKGDVTYNRRAASIVLLGRSYNTKDDRRHLTADLRHFAS